MADSDIDPRVPSYIEHVEALNRDKFERGQLPTGPDALGQLGAALEHLSAHLEQTVVEYRAVLRLTQEINSGLLLDDVLDRLYETFRPTIPYERIGVALLERDGALLRARWARSDADEIHIRRGYAARMEGSSLLDIARTGRPRIINDLEAYLRDKPESDSTRRAVAEGIRSSLTCPLIAEGGPIGFIFFSSFSRDTYADAHVDLFLSVARQLGTIIEKGALYQELLEAKKEAERLLHNVLPLQIANRLRRGGHATIADRFDAVTVLFADLVGFTRMSATMEPEQLVMLLNLVFREIDDICLRFGVEKIKTMGDAYMIAGGLPEPRPDHAEVIADVGLAIIETVNRLAEETERPLRVRVGIHTGPVVAGVIGKHKFAYDLWGDTVNVASRMESHGEPGRMQASEAAARALDGTFSLEPRGTVDIKSVGPVPVFFVGPRQA